MEAAHAEGLEISKADARSRVYGMPQAEWKEKFQLPASPEQIAAFEARTKGGC
jgi:hypothetical protein